MRTMRGKTRGLVALAALAALGLGSLASSVAFATGAGRDKNHCIQSCNALGDVCLATCPVTCAGAYTEGTAELAACLTLCTAECRDLPRHCKNRCDKDGLPAGKQEP